MNMSKSEYFEQTVKSRDIYTTGTINNLIS